MVDEDAQFFAQHPDRQARIRLPRQVRVVDKQRGAHFALECNAEFMSLGDHDSNRRRIVVWKVPKDNPFYDRKAPQLLKIPFLLFSDEEIADRDDILLPEIHKLMQEQARKYTGL